MSERWHPIETAPKDGTAVLLFTPGKGRYIGRWKKRKPEWRVVDESKPSKPQPTHWHPLPDSPTPADEK